MYLSLSSANSSAIARDSLSQFLVICLSLWGGKISHIKYFFVFWIFIFKHLKLEPDALVPALQGLTKEQRTA